MKRYIEYLKVVLKHKWYVFLGCLRVGAPLYLAVMHDITKLSPREFFPYAHHFYNADGTKRNVRSADGSYDPNKQAFEFRAAWLYHQRNKHHWQAWCVVGDGELSPLPIPEKYMREMVADWIGAGMAYNSQSNPLPWYENNKPKMILDVGSAEFIDALIRAIAP